METISSVLSARLRSVVETLLCEKDVPNAVVLAAEQAKITPASDPRFGDYQASAAMTLAKTLRDNPRAIAQALLARLEVSDLCEPPTVAGAGFLNFTLKPEYIARRLCEVGRDPRLGLPLPENPKTILFDFSAPNVAKPMHVGHIRSTGIGDALARIADAAGHTVIRDNHIGDWGTQFGMLLLGWKTELNKEALEADPIAEMERLYKLVSKRCGEDPATLQAARGELVKLQSGDEENVGIWHEMQRLSQSQFDAIYSRLNVHFDVTLGESFYNPRLKTVVQDLRDRGIAVESLGAYCVFSDGKLPEKEDPFLIQRDGQWQPNPALVQKSDGASNYTTTDLATLQYRFERWNPDEIIYVTDGRQQLHFRQLFAIFRRWYPENTARLAHVWFGTILGEDGKPFKTRSGESVKLADVLNEAEERARKIVQEKNPELPEAERNEIARKVGIGAVKYADLLPNRQSDYVFSWDRMLALQGNTAPYLLYSYVRIRSIFRKSGETFEFPGAAAIEAPAEAKLAKKLFLFPETIRQVLEDFRPNILCTYIFELASEFHSFFESCPVLKSEGITRQTRMALCDLTARILRQGLGLLGIEAPERM